MKEPSRFFPLVSFGPLFPDFWQFFRCQGRGGHSSNLTSGGYVTDVSLCELGSSPDGEDSSLQCQAYNTNE